MSKQCSFFLTIDNTFLEVEFTFSKQAVLFTDRLLKDRLFLTDIFFHLEQNNLKNNNKANFSKSNSQSWSCQVLTHIFFHQYINMCMNMSEKRLNES